MQADLEVLRRLNIVQVAADKTHYVRMEDIRPSLSSSA